MTRRARLDARAAEDASLARAKRSVRLARAIRIERGAECGAARRARRALGGARRRSDGVAIKN
jgi:hypothetical protein